MLCGKHENEQVANICHRHQTLNASSCASRLRSSPRFWDYVLYSSRYLASAVICSLAYIIVLIRLHSGPRPDVRRCSLVQNPCGRDWRSSVPLCGGTRFLVLTSGAHIFIVPGLGSQVFLWLLRLLQSSSWYPGCICHKCSRHIHTRPRRALVLHPCFPSLEVVPSIVHVLA